MGSRYFGKVLLKKLGSDLLVQSSRSGCPEQNFALYHLGIVPGEKVFKGARQGWIFIFSFGWYWEVTIRSVFSKELGSDLVVRSSR